LWCLSNCNSWIFICIPQSQAIAIIVFSGFVNAAQIAAQLEKLYDVTFIEIIDDLKRIKRTYFVYSKTDNKLNNLMYKPDKIVDIPNSRVWIFVLDLWLWTDFEANLQENWMKYLVKSI